MAASNSLIASWSRLLFLWVKDVLLLVLERKKSKTEECILQKIRAKLGNKKCLPEWSKRKHRLSATPISIKFYFTLWIQKLFIWEQPTPECKYRLIPEKAGSRYWLPRDQYN